MGTRGELERLATEAQGRVNGEPKYHGIKWLFSPPNTPHMNGVTERLVGAVKRALKATLLSEPCKFETLISLFATAMGMLNNRPLGPISFDPGSDPPLTPNTFLLGSEYEELGPTPAKDWDFSKEWLKKKKMEKALWERFIGELLPSLQGHRRWSKGGAQFQKGDVVCLLDRKRRGKWPLARVLEVYPNKIDGQVREADIEEIETGRTYRRSTKDLFRIDNENQLELDQEIQLEVQDDE